MAKRENHSTHESGTQISFIYDTATFSKDARYDRATVCKRLRELAFLNSAATIRFSGIENGEKVEESFHFEGGVAEYVRLLADGYHSLHECIHLSRESDVCDVRLLASVAMQFFLLPAAMQAFQFSVVV